MPDIKLASHELTKERQTFSCAVHPKASLLGSWIVVQGWLFVEFKQLFVLGMENESSIRWNLDVG